MNNGHHSLFLLLLQLSTLSLDYQVEVFLCPLLTLGRVQMGLQLNTHTITTAVPLTLRSLVAVVGKQ